MNIAVVGAGWAGLAAASHCLRHGAHVTLFDAAQSAGGRARGVTDERLGELDNGQHLLIGAYRDTLALITRDLGPGAIEDGFVRTALDLRSADGAFRLRAQRWLGPTVGNAIGLWLAKGLGLGDKWQATRFIERLKKGRNQPTTGTTVSQWLQSEQQTTNNLRWLWWPLCLATLNTAATEACAVLFANVLRDSLASPAPGATDLLIARKNLTEVWPSHVAERVNARWGQPVRELTIRDDAVQIGNEAFDGCVLAIPPANLKRLTAQLPQAQPLHEMLDGFEHRCITTCYVSLEQPIEIPGPMLLFAHEANPVRPAQWVFDRSAFMRQPVNAQLAFVLSDSQNLELDDADLVSTLMAQLTEALSLKQEPNVKAWRCFHEKRATFAARPGLKRPSNRTVWPRLMLAGDWTDTGYPSVIEGAVQSGLRAARELLGQKDS
jgi:squalene-associated FAD-dependent desaturase